MAGYSSVFCRSSPSPMDGVVFQSSSPNQANRRRGRIQSLRREAYRAPREKRQHKHVQACTHKHTHMNTHTYIHTDLSHTHTYMHVNKHTHK